MSAFEIQMLAFKIDLKTEVSQIKTVFSFLLGRKKSELFCTAKKLNNRESAKNIEKKLFFENKSQVYAVFMDSGHVTAD